jgi:hypothetical protein
LIAAGMIEEKAGVLLSFVIEARINLSSVAGTSGFLADLAQRARDGYGRAQWPFAACAQYASARVRDARRLGKVTR